MVFDVPAELRPLCANNASVVRGRILEKNFHFHVSIHDQPYRERAYPAAKVKSRAHQCILILQIGSDEPISAISVYLY